MPHLEAPQVCILCAAAATTPSPDGRRCTLCGWRYGAVPDADLPRPRIDVVYYLRWRDQVKIGTSSTPRRRLAAIHHDELLAFELGGREREHERHLQFASLRLGGEWFAAADELLAHAVTLRADRDPWHAHARWFAEALERISS